MQAPKLDPVPARPSVLPCSAHDLARALDVGSQGDPSNEESDGESFKTFKSSWYAERGEFLDRKARNYRDWLARTRSKRLCRPHGAPAKKLQLPRMTKKMLRRRRGSRCRSKLSEADLDVRSFSSFRLKLSFPHCIRAAPLARNRPVHDQSKCRSNSIFSKHANPMDSAWEAVRSSPYPSSAQLPGPPVVPNLRLTPPTPPPEAQAPLGGNDKTGREPRQNPRFLVVPRVRTSRRTSQSLDHEGQDLTVYYYDASNDDARRAEEEEGTLPEEIGSLYDDGEDWVNAISHSWF